MQANVLFAQVPSYVPTNDLLCWWPLNGNAQDISSNGYGGTCYNISPTIDRFGNTCSAVACNGIEMGGGSTITSNSTNFNIGQNAYSINLWFKPNNLTQVTRCLFNTNPHTGLGIAFNDNNAPGYLVYDIGPANAYWTSLYNHGTFNSFQSNVWYCMTFVKNGSNYSIYINGILEHSINLPSSSSYNYNVTWRLSGISDLYQIFNGDLDDFGFWNRALTQSEINGLYQATFSYGSSNIPINAGVDQTVCSGGQVTLTASGASTYTWSGGVQNGVAFTPTSSTVYTVTGTTSNGCTGTDVVAINVLPAPSITATSASICVGNSTTLTASSTSSISPCANLTGSLSTGLIGYWPFCGNANDVSGNGNNGTPVNGPMLTTDRFGSPNNAYSFDGINDFMSLSNQLPDASVFSISAWVYHTKGNNFSGILSDATTSSGNDLYLNVNDNSIGIKADKNGSTLFQCPLPEVGYNPTPIASGLNNGNQWKQIVIMVEPTQTKVYLNSVLVASLNIGGSNIGSHALSPVFGKITDGDYSIQYLGGKLDDIGIWNRALTTTEIQQLYTQGQTTYSWTPGGATTPSITVSPTSTTTYTCAVTNGNGTCSSDFVVTVNPLPNVNAGLDQSVCASTITTLTATGASTYSWTGGIQNGIPFIPSATTTYTVTGTNIAGCTATDQVLVTVNPLPTIAPISGSNTVCEGATLNLSNTTAGGTWSSSNTNIATVNNSGVVSGILAGSVNITYTFTDANGCSNSAVKSITVNPTPNATITVTGSLNICPGQTVTLCAPSGTGYSYLWCNATITSCITTSFAGTYCLIVTNSFGCSSSNNQIIVNVLPTPISNAGPDVTKNCIQNPTGAVIGTAAVAGNTYAWTPTTGLSSATAAQPTANPLVSTTYTVTTTNSAGCTATDQVIVTVNTFQPTANAGLDFTKTCLANVNGLLIGSTSVTGNTYAWTPTTGLSSATVSNPTANPTTTTTYTLTTTNTASGCTATDQVLVTVDNQGPTVNAGIDLSKTCVSNVNGATIGMTAIAGNSYTWTPASGLSSTTIANPFANPTVTTTYTVSSTNPTTGCTATDQIVVTVNNTPPTANAGLDATVSCNTNVGGAQLGTPTVPGNTYAWTPSIGLNSSTLSQPTANPAANTTYNLTVTTTASGCTSTDQVDVTVNTTPASVNAGPDGSVNCLNNGTGYGLGSTPIAGMTYAWTPSTGLSSATVANPLANPSVATVYTLTATNAASGCTATDQVTVFINIQVPSVDAGLNQIICAGTTVTLSGNGSVGATFQWNNGVQNGVAFVPTTTTTFTLTATAANGCSSTDQVIVSVNALPVVSAGPDINACDGSAVTLSGSGALTYTWQPAVQNGQAFIPVNSSAFIVTGTDANNCHQTDTVQVNVVQSTSSTLNENACDSYTLNGQTYTQSGTYTQVIPNGSGCDSTITLNLSMDFSPITPIITLTNGVTMTTPAQANVSFQWINCSDLTPIAGATGTTFTASMNGVYAVVASNGCGSDTSECSTINSVGIVDLSGAEISVFPNPTDGVLQVQVSTSMLGQTWKLYDIRGRLVVDGNIETESTNLSMEQLSRGTYWLHLGHMQPLQVVKN
jgi:hypothetical protein